MAARRVTQSEHDLVVQRSATTYEDSIRTGHKISINPDGQKNQRIGGEGNEKYPDVVVWMPSSPGSSSGTAKIIEEIETEESVNENEATQWKEYAGLGIPIFRLIVPKSKAAEAKAIVEKKKIGVSDIWIYTITSNDVHFQEYHAFSN